MRRGAGAPSWPVTLLLLAAVLAAAAGLRLVGLDWDNGHHLHPDERFLTMVGSSLGVPQDFLGYLDTDTSPLNPRNRGHDFLSYGTWSLTLVHLVAAELGRTAYGEIYMVGRAVSAWFDVLSVLLVFGIGWRLYDRRVGLLAALLTAFTAFHVQQAHFYTVEAPLTAFVLLAIFGLAGALRARSTPRRYAELALAGLGLGMALGTKVSVWLLAPVAVVVLMLAALRGERWPTGRGEAGSSDELAARLPVRSGSGSRSRSSALWGAAAQVVFLGLISFVTLKMAQPDLFAGPGWPNVVANPARYQEVTAGRWSAPEWWQTLRAVMPDALEMYLLPDPRWADSMHRIQTQVTGFGMDWPPNHQWWGRKAYLFPWQNMVRWGMGVPLGLAATLAWAAAGLAIWRGERRHLLLWLWVGAFFAFSGIQWGKTMRYYLPIYPALTLLGAWWLVRAWDRGAGDDRGSPSAGEWGDRRRWPLRWTPRSALAALTIVVGGTVLWGLMFAGIYTRDHSQVMASKWIYHNLPTAFALRIAPEGDGTFEIAGDWLPAQPAAGLSFEGFTWLVDDSAWVGPSRVLLPYGVPEPVAAAEGAANAPESDPDEAADPLPEVQVDGARVAYVSDPSGQGRAMPLEVVLATSAWLDDSGEPADILARGRGVSTASVDEGHVVVDFEAPATLTPGGEYHLWLRAADPPVAGRSSVLAYETPWDLPVPHGMLGYGAYDDPNSAWAEGLFGVQNFEMYGEEAAEWLSVTLDGIDVVDYWVSPTNRVYDAIERLPMRFPQAIRFYDGILFAERQGWRLTADLHSYPGYGPLQIDDQPAEEAFHVYDHPRVLIWRKSADYDRGSMEAELAPLAAERRWRFPPVSERPVARFLDALLGRIPVERALAVGYDPGPVCGLLGDLSGRPIGFRDADLAEGNLPLCRRLDALLGHDASQDVAVAAQDQERPPLEAVMLDPQRLVAQRSGGTWSRIFDRDGLVNRSEPLALVVWYLALTLLGVLAMPWLSAALPRFKDGGWSLARTTGLLLVSWLAWWIASLGLAPHTPWLVAAVVGLLAGLSHLTLRRRGGTWRGLWRDHREDILASELVFAVLFGLFVVIRASNPDLWHPWKGGEKPMDLAYFNAVLRSVSFPPYDPWFAGGQLNYYYYGFVFVGALVELTRIVPWVAYNLAIPTLAALTGQSAYGIVRSWLAARPRIAARQARLGGVLASVLAVLAGNLYQLRFVTEQMCRVSPLQIESRLPGLSQLACLLGGLRETWFNDAVLPIRTEWWYWNASRAIPYVEGDVQPITEFPFFTFLYGDLHAHMMAMPIALLAVGIALAWALPSAPKDWRGGWLDPGAAARMGLAALAVGALWPANTWDFPTYGLVLAGGLAVGALARTRRFDLEWVLRVALPGALLLGLSLLAFQPYHANYVTPYSEFSPWTGHKTPLGAYLTVHGITLFAIASWALWQAGRALAPPRGRLRRSSALAALLALGGAAAWLLWSWSMSAIAPHLPPPTPWTPPVLAALLALAAWLVFQRRLEPAHRFAAWLFLVGVLLTALVEYVVLSGDIGRMNTVFKFYIQVWLLWALAAAYAATTLFEAWRRVQPSAAGAWRAAFVALLAAGLLYPVTASRAKAGDRFPAMAGAQPPQGQDWRDQWRFGLDGVDFMGYAVYDDASYALDFSQDLEAMRYLMDTVEGTPTILEGYRVEAYRWGARYSIHTGLPTVIGWDWHQKQQRNAVGSWYVDDRTRDVATIYDTTDAELAWSLLERYGVEYVIVGAMERAFQNPEGLAKFERWVEQGRIEQAFANEDVTIYRLPPPDEPVAEGAP